RVSYWPRSVDSTQESMASIERSTRSIAGSTVSTGRCRRRSNPRASRRARSSSARLSGPLQLHDLHRLTRRRTLRHRVRELHVADAVLERGVGDLLAAANGVDELLLDAPADAPVGGNRDLGECSVAASSAREPARVRLQAQRAIRPEDPRLA